MNLSDGDFAEEEIMDNIEETTTEVVNES